MPEHDQRLVRFLLGQVGEDERQAIERECFRADSEAFAEIVALEDELRVAFAQGRLSGGDRRAFEQRYLATLSDRARLAFARALARVADRGAGSGTVVAPGVAAGAWWRRPAVSLTLAAATLVLGIATVLLVFTTRRLQQDVVRLRVESERATGRQDVAPQPRPLVALTLLPGLSRSAGEQVPRVAAGDAARGLRVTLALPAGAAPAASYEAVILDVDGHELRTLSGLDRRDAGVDLTIPASTLAAGDYQLTLRAVGTDGRARDVADYYVRVVAR